MTDPHIEPPADYGNRSFDECAALIRAAPALYDAAEPFAEISGEGDEDFPDFTPVTVIFGRTTNHTLTLGDLRRIQRAVAKADGQP